MFTVAANALATFVSEQDLARGRLFPRIRDIRLVSKQIAVASTSAALWASLAQSVCV